MIVQYIKRVCGQLCPYSIKHSNGLSMLAEISFLYIKYMYMVSVKRGGLLVSPQENMKPNSEGDFKWFTRCILRGHENVL